MDRDFNVLVVCTGNINRSALGAALLKTWVDWYLPAHLAQRVRVTSAGLGAPVGSPMGQRVRAIAEALGSDGSSHRAAQISEETIRAADLVLVASADQRHRVLGQVPGALRSTFTIREAGLIVSGLPAWEPPVSVDELRSRVAVMAEHRATAADAGDIVDPQGKDDDAYRLMVQQEVPPLARLAGALFGMPNREITAYESAADAAEFSFDDGPRRPRGGESGRRRGRREA